MLPIGVSEMEKKGKNNDNCSNQQTFRPKIVYNTDFWMNMETAMESFTNWKKIHTSNSLCFAPWWVLTTQSVMWFWKIPPLKCQSTCGVMKAPVRAALRHMANQLWAHPGWRNCPWQDFILCGRKAAENKVMQARVTIKDTFPQEDWPRLAQQLRGHRWHVPLTSLFSISLLSTQNATLEVLIKHQVSLVS